MSALREQIANLTAAEKAELLDEVWESLEADRSRSPTRNGPSWIPGLRASSRTPPMSFPGKRSGRICLKNCEADPSSGCPRPRRNCAWRGLGTTTFDLDLGSVLQLRWRLRWKPSHSDHSQFPVVHRGRRRAGVQTVSVRNIL